MKRKKGERGMGNGEEGRGKRGEWGMAVADATGRVPQRSTLNRQQGNGSRFADLLHEAVGK